jgi:NAD(P)-dependent dehydrogenase (short-subunit alcohol dehydrogenase family)
MGRVDGKVVLITGAGEGIGKALATLFAAEGGKIVLAGRRRAPLEAVAATLPGASLVVTADVTVEADVIAMVEAAVCRFGRVDVLLNNAAQPGKDHFLWEQTLENWNSNLAVNVTGPMLCTREVLRQSMIAQRSGAIVNFSSYISWQGKVRKSHYCVSKAGLRLLTKVTAKEAGEYGVRANCIVLGPTLTDLLVRYTERIGGERGVDPEVIAQDYRSASALGQINTPEQVAETVLFLASDGASGMTGQSISVDAGSYLVG